MKKALFSVFAVIFLLAITCVDIRAQATAQITGTVKDQTGAVLPGVEVTATQTDTGIARTAVTNETGSYVLSNLAIGPYRLEATLPGFRTYAQTGIVLEVNANPVINPTLEVGQVSEQVEVQANATQVETRSVGVGQVVENARILDLPLNGRQVVDLIGLAGGTVPAPINNGNSRDSFASAAFSVAGGLNAGITYTLDGAHHQNPQDNSYVAMPFPDALQEFKLETSGTSADKGMKTAGAVSLVTKSGTNEIHGDLFEFVRNGMFNARNAFALKRDTIKRNQFGGTVGGPIAKNRLFFFAGYQGTRIRQDPSDLIAFGPTAAMNAGDFTTFASPACNAGKTIALRAPFVNNRVDPGQFSKPALAYASKLPQTTDPCGKTVYGNPTFENGHMAIGRIDYQKSAKHTIFGRYLMEHLFDPAPYDLNHNPLSSAGNSTPKVDAMSQAFTIGSTYLLSANIVNSLRLTANRIAAGKFEPDSLPKTGLGLADVGVKAFSYQPYFLPVNVTGGFNINNTAGSARIAVFGVNDDISVARGNHQMAFGVNMSEWWVNSYTNTYYTRFAFNGNTTGSGLADFLTGHASSFQAGSQAPQNKRDAYAAVFAADTWKLKPRLTLNYGLRWQPYFPMVHRDGSAIHFDDNALKNGIKSGRFDNSPPGVFFNGDPGFPGNAGAYTRWTNFSPRVGLAWDVTGDGRTSLRASGGTFYDFPNTHYLVSLSSSAPWNPRYTLTGDVNFENPWGNTPGGDPFPMPTGKDVARNVPCILFSTVTAMNYDIKNMEVAQWNLSLQSQIGNDWLVSGSYLGTETSHMWTLQQMNPAVFMGLGACTIAGVQYATCSTTSNNDQRRRFNLAYPVYGKYYGDVPRIAAEGNAGYNALLVSVQRRAARGVTLNANYTWSHCISDHPQPQQTAFGTNGNVGWTNGDRRADRGNCSQSSADRRHLFNLSAVASTPGFANPALRALGSNWRFSPILKILSGEAMTIVTTLDRALTGMFIPGVGSSTGTVAGQRVNQVLGDPYGDGTPGNFLNSAAFASPAMGTFGNVGMGSIKWPGSWQFDLSLYRAFQIRELKRLEFLAEAFNVTNSFNMNNPTTDFNSNLFGKVTSSKDPRIMQFALKFLF